MDTFGTTLAYRRPNPSGSLTLVREAPLSGEEERSGKGRSMLLARSSSSPSLKAPVHHDLSSATRRRTRRKPALGACGCTPLSCTSVLNLTPCSIERRGNPRKPHPRQVYRLTDRAHVLRLLVKETQKLFQLLPSPSLPTPPCP